MPSDYLRTLEALGARPVAALPASPSRCPRAPCSSRSTQTTFPSAGPGPSNDRDRTSPSGRSPVGDGPPRPPASPPWRARHGRRGRDRPRARTLSPAARDPAHSASLSPAGRGRPRLLRPARPAALRGPRGPRARESLGPRSRRGATMARDARPHRGGAAGARDRGRPRRDEARRAAGLSLAGRPKRASGLPLARRARERRAPPRAAPSPREPVWREPLHVLQHVSLAAGRERLHVLPTAAVRRHRGGGRGAAPPGRPRRGPPAGAAALDPAPPRRARRRNDPRVGGDTPPGAHAGRRLRRDDALRSAGRSPAGRGVMTG